MEAAGRRTVLGDDRSITSRFDVGRSVRFIIPALLVFAISSCSRPAPSADTLQAAAAKADDHPVQKLELTYDKPVVGADVRFSAAGLPAGKTVDLNWST